MDKDFNLLELMSNVPIVSIPISSTKVNIHIFFNMNCCEKMLEYHVQGDNYRSAFAKAVFHMYQNTKNDEEANLSEKDFLNIEDESLILILDRILEQDESLKFEYDKEENGNEYERFYKANNVVLEKTAANISISLDRISKTFEFQNKALSSFSKSMDAIIKPHFNSLKMSSAAANLPIYDEPRFKSIVANIPEFKFPELTSALKNIQQPVFDTQDLLSPLKSLADSIHITNDSIANMLQAPLLQMAEAMQSLVTSFVSPCFSLQIYLCRDKNIEVDL